MKLTTVKNNKSEYIKPISNVFKLKQMIQKAANTKGQQNKQNFQTNMGDSCISNTLQSYSNNSTYKFPKKLKNGVFLANKTQRSKSEMSDKPDQPLTNFKTQLNNLNFHKLKINPICQSVKSARNKNIQPTKFLIKSLSNKTIASKKIQGLNKSYKCPLNMRQELSIDSFILGKKLGKGRFGNVYTAQQKDTNLILALKIINKKQLKQAEMQQQLLSQIKLQSYMKHPNILQMYGFFHDQNNIYLMLELAQKCLFKDLRRKTCLAEKQVAYYTKQIIEGLKYIHSQNIIHRDLKPQNIMLTNNVIKLADFGWSVYSPLYKRQTFCGTLDYVPPQIVSGDYYDERVDVWSLGILIFQLTFGYAPFQGSNSQEQTFQRIINGQFQIPQFATESLKRVIKYVLIKDPKHRLNLRDIYQSAWLRTYQKQGRNISSAIWDFWESQ